MIKIHSKGQIMILKVLVFIILFFSIRKFIIHILSKKILKSIENNSNE